MDSTKLTITTFIVIWLKIGRILAINGGYVSLTNDFDYQVSVQVKKIHICGGAIIGDRYVLTAAQFFIGEDGRFINREYTVLAGVSSLNENSRRKIEINVEKVFVPSVFEHAENPDRYSRGDIAVLKLKSNFNFSKNERMHKLELPTTNNYEYPAMEMIVSGFGNGDSTDGSLKFAHTNIVNNAKCQEIHRTTIHNCNVCASVIQHDDEIGGTTAGDRGGPLVLNGRTIIGILIGGPADSNELIAPGIYTSVFDYLEFINRSMIELRSYDIRFAQYIRVTNGCCNSLKILAEGSSE